jgi:hypothetical protein
MLEFGQKVNGNALSLLERLEAETPELFDQALHQDALELEADSVAVVPVEEAELQRSSRVEKIDGGYTVGYYKDYALYVHEMPDTNNFTKPGTGPKFLQRPHERRVKDFEGRMARRLKQAMGV